MRGGWRQSLAAGEAAMASATDGFQPQGAAPPCRRTGDAASAPVRGKDSHLHAGQGGHRPGGLRV